MALKVFDQNVENNLQSTSHLVLLKHVNSIILSPELS